MDYRSELMQALALMEGASVQGSANWARMSQAAGKIRAVITDMDGRKKEEAQHDNAGDGQGQGA